MWENMLFNLLEMYISSGIMLVHFRPHFPPFMQEWIHLFWAQWSSNHDIAKHNINTEYGFCYTQKTQIHQIV